MPGWFIPSIIGVIVTGVALGLLISYVIIRVQRRKSSFGPESDIPPSAVGQIETYKATNSTKTKLKPEPPVKKIKKPAPTRRTVEDYSNPGKDISTVKKSALPENSEALQELENNLEIATRPTTDKLMDFQTNVWNTRRSEFNTSNRALTGELTEAYVDMLLANNVVWLVMELGRDSQDLRSNYAALKNKVAERLQRIMPAVRDSFSKG